MKVFIYSKKSSKKVATLIDVVAVEELKSEKSIICTTSSGEAFKFNTQVMKTTIYQN